MVKKIVNLLHLKGDEKILDIGCGEGIFSIEAALHLKTGNVLGIDILDQKKLKEANDYAKDHGVENIVSFMSAEVNSISLENETFDLAVSVNFLHELRSVEERHAVLKEIARIVKPGGRVILIDVQFSEEHATFFSSLGWPTVKLSKRRWFMFPPVRIVTAIKPFSE